ncbi:hypothetical protein ABID30_001917 [Enterococcus rotai]
MSKKLTFLLIPLFFLLSFSLFSNPSEAAQAMPKQTPS